MIVLHELIFDVKQELKQPSDHSVLDFVLLLIGLEYF